MNRIFLTIISLIICLISCKNQINNKDLKINQPPSSPFINKDTLAIELGKCLDFEDDILYNQFLLNWNKQFQPNNIDVINQNEAIKSIFEIFKVLYKPIHIDELGSWQKNINREQKYYVVQNIINFGICNSKVLKAIDLNNCVRNHVNNFRPPLDIKQSKVLYLSNEYKEVYSAFLNGMIDKLSLDLHKTVDPNAKEDSKITLIKDFFSISQDSNLENWNIVSNPYISFILLNSAYDSARVEFTVDSQGGEATLQKKNNEWVILESHSTWIE